MIDVAAVPTAAVAWRGAVRIIRSIYPPVDLFEDIAEPADWPLLLSAEQKTNPRIMETVGNLDLVPPGRRVGGPGASFLMAPFTHVSADRTSRFGDGTFGVLYVGRAFRVALLETAWHHGRFMAQTGEPAGWTSQFREIVLDVRGTLHDLRRNADLPGVLDPDDYRAGQQLGRNLRSTGSEGIVYPSVRCRNGTCAALFHPDLAARPRQGQHLDYHWNGQRVDYYRDASTGEVFKIVATEPGA